MPIRCTFELNSQSTSFLNCPGVGMLPAFSGRDSGTGDSTYVGKIKRGQFRLHPVGRMRLSEGCITITNPTTFYKFAEFLRKNGADLPVPGSNLKAYGTVEVK